MGERTVLVTGASGFVGGHLCAHLVARGWAVRAAVRRTASPILAGDPIVVADAGPGADWSAALAGIDFVVHCAAVAHRVGAAGPAYEAECFRINTEGTRMLAQAAVRAGVGRLVLVSSVGAMASASEVALSETSECRPDGPYGRSKLAAENALRESCSGKAIEWSIIRPPLVYGPGNPGNMARLQQLVATGLPLPFGAIRNRRSFAYVGNLVSALEALLVEPAAAGAVYLMSDGDDLSTPDLVRLLAELSGRRARLASVPVPLLKAAARAGDLIKRVVGRSPGLDSYSVERLVSSLTVDITRIRRDLGWAPPFSVRQGLAATVAA